MTRTLFFKSADHQQRFVTTIQQIGKVYGGKLDQEYAAALSILTADTDTWEAVQRYVSRRGIRFDLMDIRKSAGNPFSFSHTINGTGYGESCEIFTRERLR